MESDEAYFVTAELPGVDDKDIEIRLNDDTLTLRGDKKIEHEGRRRQFSERYYRRFERRMALPSDVEQDKVKAAFRNGVLTATRPTSKEALRTMRRIPLPG